MSMSVSVSMIRCVSLPFHHSQIKKGLDLDLFIQEELFCVLFLTVWACDTTLKGRRITFAQRECREAFFASCSENVTILMLSEKRPWLRAAPLSFLLGIVRDFSRLHQNLDPWLKTSRRKRKPRDKSSHEFIFFSAEERIDRRDQEEGQQDLSRLSAGSSRSRSRATLSTGRVRGEQKSLTIDRHNFILLPLIT